MLDQSSTIRPDNDLIERRTVALVCMSQKDEMDLYFAESLHLGEFILD